MAKRLLSLLLALALLCPILPAPAQAAGETGVFVTIQTCSGSTTRQRLVYALEEGSDLLLSAEDLADFSGFFLARSENTLTFSRGYKVVSVDLTASTVKLCDSQNPDTVCSSAAALPSKVVTQGEQVFLSAAGMLPRLNVSCHLEDGLLTIAPNPLSLWDFIHDVSLSDYVFDIAYCAQVLDCSQKHIRSLVYTNNDLSESIIYSIDSGHADTEEFYAVFDRFVQDETAADEAVEYLRELYGTVANLAEGYSDLFAWLDLVCPYSSAIFNADFVGGMGKVFAVAETAARLLTYYNLFHQDNTHKISMMKSLVNCYGNDYNDQLITAARQIIMTYENFWLGLFFNTGYDLTNALADFISFESLREAFRVNYLGQLPDNELLEQTVYFESLMDACRRVYNKGFDPNNRQQLQAWYDHAMLYFYSVEQIYWGMAQHVIDKKGGTFEQLQAFQRTAHTMESMYGKYLAASLYLNNDLFDNHFFSGKESEFLASLPHVTRKASGGNASAAAEQGIFLSALWEMDVYEPQWHVGDMDLDGKEELLIFYNDGCMHTVVMDDWAMDHQMAFFVAYDTFQLLQTADGQVIQRHDYDDGEYAYTTFYTWNGQGWSKNAQWRNFASWEGDTWADTYHDDFWEVDGTAVDKDTYLNRATPFLDAEPLPFNYTDCTSRVISGDGNAMIADLNAHFSSRDNFIKSLQLDVGNDGNMDRLYLLFDAANIWLDLQDPWLEIYGPSSLHTYRDRKATLVLAENLGSSIHLRVQRLPIPYFESPDLLADAKVSGSTLTIGNETYFYQEAYEPFSTNPMFGGSPTDVLIGLTPKEVRSKLKDYREWFGSGEGIAQGYLDGVLVQVWYASHFGMEDDGGDRVLSANVLEHYPTPYSICYSLGMQMDVFTIVRTVYPGDTNSTPWSAVKIVEDTDGTKLSKTTCYYNPDFNDNVYLLTLLYPYEEDDPMPVAFYAELVEPGDIPESVKSKLFG